MIYSQVFAECQKFTFQISKYFVPLSKSIDSCLATILWGQALTIRFLTENVGKKKFKDEI